MTALPDFEMQWIRDEVAAIQALGSARLEAWLSQRSDVLGSGELAMSDDDPDRLGQRLMFGLGVIGHEPRSGHSEVEGVQELWELLAESGAHHLVAARASRNLWRARCGSRPHEHGQRAIALFEAVASGTGGRACERAQARVEAIELAAEMRAVKDLKVLVTSAETALGIELKRCARLSADDRGPELGASTTLSLHQWANEASTELESTQHHGACLYLIRGLAALESGRFRDRVDHDRVVRAADHLADLTSARDLFSRHMLEVRLELAHGDADERRRVIEQHIGWTRSIVSDADGPRRYVTLMHCEELARDSGLSELADDLRAELQEISAEDLGLRSTRVTAQVPPQLVESAHATVESICSPDDLVERLRRLAFDGVSAWWDASGRREVPLPETPLADSFPSVTIGHHNVPARRTGGGESDELAERARWESARIKLETDLVVVPALTALAAAQHEDLVAALVSIGDATRLLDEQRAECCADAIRDWRDGRTDAALHAVVPRIEYVIRRAAELRRLPVIRPTDGSSRGVHDTLGQVMDVLAGRADPNLLLHLRTVLVDDSGINLRNDVAHGDIPRGDQRMSAVAIHTLLLSLFGLAPAEGSEKPR